MEELPESNREVLRYLLQFLQRVNELTFYLLLIKLKGEGFLLFYKIIVLKTLFQNKENDINRNIVSGGFMRILRYLGPYQTSLMEPFAIIVYG